MLRVATAAAHEVPRKQARHEHEHVLQTLLSHEAATRGARVHRGPRGTYHRTRRHLRIPVYAVNGLVALSFGPS